MLARCVLGGPSAATVWHPLLVSGKRPFTLQRDALGRSWVRRKKDQPSEGSESQDIPEHRRPVWRAAGHSSRASPSMIPPCPPIGTLTYERQRRGPGPARVGLPQGHIESENRTSKVHALTEAAGQQRTRGQEQTWTQVSPANWDHAIILRGGIAAAVRYSDQRVQTLTRGGIQVPLALRGHPPSWLDRHFHTSLQ